MKLLKKIKITLTYTNLTGLHIGGNKEDVKIGGLDNPVIKIKSNDKEFVYVPGSSLKGKIRSLLELAGYAGKDYNNYNPNDKKAGDPCDCGDCKVCKLFGSHQSREIKEKRRLIFRDSNYIDYLNITEEKIENTINRITGTTIKGGIRKQERVIPGTIFNQEIIFDVYNEEDTNLFKVFLEGLELLENDYLGGSGSRGYGKIKFLKIEIEDMDKKTKKPIGKEVNKKQLSIDEVNKLMEEDSILKDKKNELIEEFEKFVSGNNGNDDV